MELLPEHYKTVLSDPQKTKLIEILDSHDPQDPQDSFKSSLFSLFSAYDIIDLIVKECVETSYIHNSLLEIENTKQEPITLICGGQSPAYFCYAMMHLKVFNPEKVN